MIEFELTYFLLEQLLLWALDSFAAQIVLYLWVLSVVHFLVRRFKPTKF